MAPALGVQPEQLEAVDGRIQVKGNPIEEHDLEGGLPEARGRQDHRDGRQRRAQAATAVSTPAASAGVQMADVSVDTETGIVKMTNSSPSRIAA